MTRQLHIVAIVFLLAVMAAAAYGLLNQALRPRASNPPLTVE